VGHRPVELDKSVTARVPTRTNTDDRYFTDTFQAMPLEGYTRMFERMLDHPNIDVLLGVDYEEARAAYPHDHLVFTGPIDEYFGHRYGKLPYRSLQFRHESHECEWFQSVAVVNYPAESVPHTRITEYKYLTGQQSPRTSITYEIPSAVGDPYYPIPREENQALFKRYEALAIAQPDVTFVGRLATYRYYNMDQVVGQALSTYRRLAAKLAENKAAPFILAPATPLRLPNAPHRSERSPRGEPSDPRSDHRTPFPSGLSCFNQLCRGQRRRRIRAMRCAAGAAARSTCRRCLAPCVPSPGGRHRDRVGAGRSLQMGSEHARRFGGEHRNQVTNQGEHQSCSR
jgi:hypothetical protein